MKISPAKSASDVGGKPEPSGFQQAYKDSNAKVEVLGDDVAGRRGQRDASTAEKPVKSPLLLHDLGGERAVEKSDEHA